MNNLFRQKFSTDCSFNNKAMLFLLYIVGFYINVSCWLSKLWRFPTRISVSAMNKCGAFTRTVFSIFSSAFIFYPAKIAEFNTNPRFVFPCTFERTEIMFQLKFAFSKKFETIIAMDFFSFWRKSMTFAKLLIRVVFANFSDIFSAPTFTFHRSILT